MARFVASFFGSGFLLRALRGADIGSGTVASLLALGIAMAIRPLGWEVQAAVAASLVVVSLVVVRPFAAEEGDPNWVVIDEAAGTLIATIGLGMPAALIGWAVFRLADITKWFPGIAAAERLPGAVGVTADDLVAGLYGLGAGWALEWLL